MSYNKKGIKGTFKSYFSVYILLCHTRFQELGILAFRPLVQLLPCRVLA